MSIQSTQRRFYKVPPTLRFFMSADSLTAKSSAHLGDSQATGCCCGGRGGTLRTAARSGDKILVVLVWQPKP